jgi:hypothetical protein
MRLDCDISPEETPSVDKLDIIVATRDTAVEGQSRAAVCIFIERAYRTQLQPSVPGAAMVET